MNAASEGFVITAQHATLIAAMIAAIAGAANIFVSSWAAGSLERRKIDYARREEERRGLRLALAEFTRELAIAVQRIEWLAWKAENNAAALVQGDLDLYETDMRAILPRLFTAQVVVAAHSRAVYDRLAPLARAAYAFDDRIARANVSFQNSPEAGLAELQRIAADVWQFARDLPAELSAAAAAT